MSNSIANLKCGAENSTIEDWRGYLDGDHTNVGIILQAMRNPLKNCRFHADNVRAVFGFFESNQNISLVYFWHRTMVDMRLKALSRSESYHYLRFGMLLARLYSDEPKMEKIVDYHGDLIGTRYNDLDCRPQDCNVFWGNRSNHLKFVCLYRDVENSKSAIFPKSLSSLTLPDCLAFHHDYFLLKSVIWNSSPMRYLFHAVQDSEEQITKLHLHPKCFEPDIVVDDSIFLWPWQRCIFWDRNNNVLRHRSIITTSLVFDLRRSTIAMEQLDNDDLGLFPEFINLAVHTAKEIIFEFGGFFDKETGDGLVGHFIGFEDIGGNLKADQAEKRAFDSAVKIVRAIGKQCEEFKRKLTFGVDGLGASVGIHTADAVWICKDNKVAAIGKSVIVASRLCQEATIRNIFVSNKQFNQLQKSLDPDVADQFRKTTYAGKELARDAALYGYSIEIGDLV